MSKTAISALLSRINADNPSIPTPLTASNVTFGTPNALTGDSTGKNTSVTVAGTGTPYTTDQATIKYDRVDLTTLFASNSTQIPWTTQANSSDLLVWYNSLTGANLQTSDIVVEALPTNPADGSTVSYDFKSNSTSLGFQGDLNVSLVSTAAPLSISGLLAVNHSPVNTAYNQSLNIVGGTAPFTNARLDTTKPGAATALPTGLSLSISGSTVVLSGTPTVAFQGNLYIAVDSSDGQTATSVVQSIMITSGNWMLWASKPTNITITSSGTNSVATRNDTVSGIGTCRGSTSTLVKQYLEIVCNVLGTAGTINNWNNAVLGFMLSTESNAQVAGNQSGTHSVGYNTATDGSGGHGQVMYNGVGGLTGPAFINGDILGIAIDSTVRSAVKIWFSRNGVWLNSGDPANGLNPMATADWTTGTYQLSCGTLHGTATNSGGAQQLVLKANPANHTYTAPAGFVAGQFV